MIEQAVYSKIAGKKIICIGDSLTAGDLGKSDYSVMNVQPQSYPYFLSKKTGAITTNMGSCGWTAEMVWNRKINGKAYLECIKWEIADIILIELGTNGHLNGSKDSIDESIAVDLAGEDYRSYNRGTTEKPNQLGCYGSIIKYAQEKAPNAVIVLLDRPLAVDNMTDIQKKIAETVMKVGRRFGVEVLENYGITENNKNKYIGKDNVHLTVAGYEKMAIGIAEKLESISAFDTPVAVAGPKAYIVDGKKTVFVKNLTENGAYSAVNFNNCTYYAYSTMNNALAALGEDGGIIKICGNFVEEPDYNTGTMAFLDVMNRKCVTIEGIDNDSAWELKNQVKMYGDVVFSNITLRQTVQKGGAMISLAEKGEFKNDCKIDTSTGWIFLSCATETILNGNEFTAVDFLGSSERTVCSELNPVNRDVILNYNHPESYPNLNCGYCGAAKDYYGNLNIYVNGTGFGVVPTDSNPNGRIIHQNNLSDKFGIFTLIFNNGSSRTKDPNDKNDEKTSHYNYIINSAIDYIVKSDMGGTVSIKENGNISCGRAPTFKLVPDLRNLVPYIGATEIKMTEGEYLYTPELSDVQTTISVSWIDNPEITDLYKLKFRDISNESYGYIGRWYNRTVENKMCKATITAGSELYFKVQNTENIALSLKSQADQPPTLAVSIDGNPPIRVFTGKVGNTVIAQGLNKKTPHTVRVIVDAFYEYQRNKWISGNGFVFEKAIVDRAGEIVGIIPENKIILYFGDSITEGIHALQRGSNPYGNSYIGTYAFTNSSLLKMVSYASGYGGTGVTKGGSGGVPKCIDVVDRLYGGDKSLPYYPTIEEIAAIIINHGANDKGAGVSSSDYMNEYYAVVRRIAELFPNIPIIALANVYGAMRDEVKKVATELNTEGINIRYINIGGGTGADMNYESLDWCHPTSAAGRFLGERLASELMNIIETPKK